MREAARAQHRFPRSPPTQQPKLDYPSTKPPAKDPLAKLTTEALEEKIEKLAEETREIDEQLADPDTWRDRKKNDRLQKKRERLQQELEPLEFEWSRRAESE